jgi:hypothetical protein
MHIYAMTNQDIQHKAKMKLLNVKAFHSTLPSVASGKHNSLNTTDPKLTKPWHERNNSCYAQMKFTATKV